VVDGGGLRERQKQIPFGNEKINGNETTKGNEKKQYEE
jgi:hypothetical protein